MSSKRVTKTFTYDEHYCDFCFTRINDTPTLDENITKCDGCKKCVCSKCCNITILSVGTNHSIRCKKCSEKLEKELIRTLKESIRILRESTKKTKTTNCFKNPYLRYAFDPEIEWRDDICAK